MLNLQLTKRKKILILTILISWLLLLIGFLIKDTGVFGNIIILSIFIIVAPQFILTYVEFREIKDIEYAYPNFLRDLADATKSGMPFHTAIISLSKNNYGSLTPEIKKMATQLSWNVDLIKVLEKSMERLKRSPNLVKTIRILIETYKSGGEISEILDSLSNTLITLQDTEKERNSSLKQYVTAMYAISFVFIGVVVGMSKLMVPIFESSASNEQGILGFSSSNPCSFCIFGVTLQCLPCNIYSGICSLFSIDQVSISCYYFALFFSMSVIQSITGGIVAGQIGEGSPKAGIKHSLILFSVTVAAFMILVRLKIIGV